MQHAFATYGQAVMSPVMSFGSAQTAVFEQTVPIRATIMLTGIEGKSWHLAQPLVLQFEIDRDGSHLISDSVFLVYGVGDTLEEAMTDYTRSLMEYYEIVARNVTDEATARQLAHLQRYLKHTP
jgi:hypothetical protein